MHDEMREPTEEELRAAMEEQMSQIRVEDVILQSVATLVNLAGRRLGLAGTESERDLEQAKLAIDAARALVPLAAEEQREPIRQALTQVQMAFAREAGQPAAGEQAAAAQPGDTQEGAQPQPDAKADEDAERARARSKIWTPPGS